MYRTRRLLSLLLVFCLAAELLPACADAEASDYVPSTAARRNRGVGFEDPMAHYWDFEPDDEDKDYLIQNNVNAAEATSYTAIIVWRPEDWNAATYLMSHSSDTTDLTWELYVSATKWFSFKSGRNACDVALAISNQDGLWNAGLNGMAAITFDYSGNVMQEDSTGKLYLIRDSTDVVTDATMQGPVLNCTGKLCVGCAFFYEGAAVDGRVYWWAYYDSVLTQANLEDLYDGTLHPATDFTPVIYVDFSKAVAGTYAPEVGAEYVFTVHGTPVQGP